MTCIEIDMALCRALGKRPYESLVKAAQRAIESGPNGIRQAASILIHSRNKDVWETMRRAHAALSAHVQKCRTCLATPGRRRAGHAFQGIVDGLCVYHAMKARKSETSEASP